MQLSKLTPRLMTGEPSIVTGRVSPIMRNVMSLKFRFVLITVGLSFAISLIVLLTFCLFATNINDIWGHRIVEVQVHYDSALLARPIELSGSMLIPPFFVITGLFTLLLGVSLGIIYLLLRRWFLNPLQERTQQLEALTRIDPLTDLLNRRGLTDGLIKELERSRRTERPLGILWVDLDYFKVLNDSLGHAIGDQALMSVGKLLKANLRKYDQAARWGGDEFLVVLVDCDKVTLRRLGQRICAAVEQQMQQHDWPVTVSVGGYLTQPNDTFDSLLNRADQAMYQAKQNGRNCFYSND